MGVKRLKIKDELNYRRGGTTAHCSDCNHYVEQMQVEPARDGVILAPDASCRMIGLKPGRGYKIHPNYICDRFDSSEMLRRIRGPKWEEQLQEGSNG